jgi:UDP-glucose 4-epimerase
MPTGPVLLTGGAGYIGSHTAVEMLESGWDVVVVDDFSNSNLTALNRVIELAPAGRLRWHRVDVADTARLIEILADERIDAVVHFAGLKAVGESVADPLRYFRVNVAGTASLVHAMQAVGIRQLVFSSSCTVYGTPATLPVDESAPRSPTNPYGRTKLIVEDQLGNVAVADNSDAVPIDALVLGRTTVLGARPPPARSRTWFTSGRHDPRFRTDFGRRVEHGAYPRRYRRVRGSYTAATREAGTWPARARAPTRTREPE